MPKMLGWKFGYFRPDDRLVVSPGDAEAPHEVGDAPGDRPPDGATLGSLGPAVPTAAELLAAAIFDKPLEAVDDDDFEEMEKTPGEYIAGYIGAVGVRATACFFRWNEDASADTRTAAEQRLTEWAAGKGFTISFGDC